MAPNELRKLYENAIVATHLADKAKAFALKEQATYNEAVAQAHADARVPMGYCIDVLGDGKVKLEADCAKDVPR
jgi:hypothetical protein